MRLSLSVRGVVQGVGFRPYVWREATRLGLSGWVQNARGTLEIEAQGEPDRLRDLVTALVAIPSPARVDSIEERELDELDESEFVIRASAEDAAVGAALPADLATCAECLEEVLSPRERRHAYAFTNCTRCGPRYSIVHGLPYDRERTSMGVFPLCSACTAEYDDPTDRRFHAEPIACPDCGPSLELLDPSGTRLAESGRALSEAAALLRAGKILALRGLGGFQLLCDAKSEHAVQRLRERKQRDEKPFAVMFRDLGAVRRAAKVSEADAEWLLSAEAPILLLARAGDGLAPAVAPANPRIGALLPYTPLHHLLMAEVESPVVCTSGNVSDEPMCTEIDDALARLGPIADALLVHDRAIVRPVDDSVARTGPAGIELLRRARGFAPLPAAQIADQRTIVGFGAHLKSTIALAKRGSVVVSQHIGDLERPRTRDLLERTALDLFEFFEAEPELVACDLHPDYASTLLAERVAARFGVPLVRVQHHHAHVAAIMAERAVAGPVLGLAWDGTGLGTDETIWGGEALVVDAGGARRIAHLRPFSLPGSDRAAREPWRAAAGLLFECSPAAARAFLARLLDEGEAALVQSAMQRGVGSARTTSVGRLFDAVAALTGGPLRCSFEAQAAMELEFVAGEQRAEPYPLPLSDGAPAVADFAPLVHAIQGDVAAGIDRGSIAARFHEALVDVGVRIAERAGLSDVVLSGGCMQNSRLSTGLRQRLEQAGFRVHGAGLIPTNDGGISLGQVLVAAQLQKN